MNTRFIKPHWGWSAGIVCLVFIAVVIRYTTPIKDGDLWFHMLYAEYYLQNMTLIPDHSIYSWTPSSTDTIYCTWFSDIILHFIYKLTGLTGIFILKYLSISILAVGCLALSRKHHNTAQPMVWLVCLLAVLMSYTGIVAKSEIFSFIFITIMAWNWWHIRLRGAQAWKNCYLFPLIMLLWVNSHGGFIFGCAFLACISLGELLNGFLPNAHILPRQARRHFFTAMVLSTIALFITPYGHNYLFQIFKMVTQPLHSINAMHDIYAYYSPFRPEDRDVIGFVVLINVSICVLLFLYIRNSKKIEWSSLLTNLLFVFLYTKFYRTTFFWPPIFLFSSISLINHKTLFSFLRNNWLSSHLAPALILAISIWISYSVLSKSITIPEKGCWFGYGIADMNPVAEAKFIKEHYPTARIGNSHDQGSYLLWELWPNNRVFMDARHFPYRKQKWFETYWQLFHTNLVHLQPAAASKFLDEFQCDIWCVDYSCIAMKQWFLLSPDWSPVFFGKNAVVFLHKGMPLPEQVPNFSDEITTIRNLSTAADVLTWAVTIQEWKAVYLLLGRMNSYFKDPDKKELIREYISSISQVRQKLGTNH